MHFLSDKGVAREMSSDSSVAPFFKLCKRKNLLLEGRANPFVFRAVPYDMGKHYCHIRLFTLKVYNVSKGAEIRNRYNQVPHLTQNTNGNVTKNSQ